MAVGWPSRFLGWQAFRPIRERLGCFVGCFVAVLEGLRKMEVNVRGGTLVVTLVGVCVGSFLELFAMGPAQFSRPRGGRKSVY